MTCPFAKPASAYSSLSRFDSDSVRPSICTSWRLAAGTTGTLLAVELAPDGRAREAADAPAAPPRLDQIYADAAPPGQVRGPPFRRAQRAVRWVGDLDVEPRIVAPEHQVQ